MANPFKRLSKRGFGGGQRRRALRVERAKHPLGVLLAGTEDADGLARRLGDARLAKRVRALQAQFPQGSVPELVVYDWLRSQGILFDYQVELYGGRGTRGGLIPDFVLYQNGSADVWQVQGEYWHSLRQKGFRDETANLRMLGQVINGTRVARVVELWEGDIYRQRPQIFYMALGGLEMRG